MEPQAMILLLGILIIVGAFISRPFIHPARQTKENNENRSILLAEQERLLTALQELDFDHSLGKVPEEDYPVQRAELIRLGAEVMERIDTQQIKSSTVPTSKKEDNKNLLTDGEIENLISRRRSERIEKTRSFCPKCGNAVLLTDRFCPACGDELKKIHATKL